MRKSEFTPKIQAHYRVTEIGTCLKKQVPIFMLSGSMVIAKSRIDETKIIQKAFEISIQIRYNKGTACGVSA